MDVVDWFWQLNCQPKLSSITNQRQLWQLSGKGVSVPVHFGRCDLVSFHLKDLKDRVSHTTTAFGLHWHGEVRRYGAATALEGWCTNQDWSPWLKDLAVLDHDAIFSVVNLSQQQSTWELTNLSSSQHGSAAHIQTDWQMVLIMNSQCAARLQSVS